MAARRGSPRPAAQPIFRCGSGRGGARLLLPSGGSRAAPFGVAGPEPPPAPKRHARLPNERERERRASRTRATTAPRRPPPLRLLPPRGGVAPRCLLGVALARRRRRLSARTRAGIKTVDERHVTRRSAVGRPRGSPLLSGVAQTRRRYRRQTSERARKRQSTSTSRRSARPAARLRPRRPLAPPSGGVSQAPLRLAPACVPIGAKTRPSRHGATTRLSNQPRDARHGAVADRGLPPPLRGSRPRRPTAPSTRAHRRARTPEPCTTPSTTSYTREDHGSDCNFDPLQTGGQYDSRATLERAFVRMAPRFFCCIKF